MQDTHRQTLEPLAAAVLYVLVALLLLSVGGWLQMHGLWGVIASLWLLICLPTVVMVAAGPSDLLPTLGLRPVSARHGLAAVLLGSSCWFVNMWAVLPLQELVLPVPPEVLEALEHSIAPAGAGVPLTVLAVVITPAICEELLCRGVLARSLQQRLGLAGAVALSSLMFAVLHFSIYRMAPTFTLGLVLGFVTLKTGSVLPAMIVHALNNLPVMLASSTETGSVAMVWLLDAGPWPRMLSVLAVAAGLRLFTTEIQR